MICKTHALIFTNNGSTVDDDVLVADKAQNKNCWGPVCRTETSVALTIVNSVNYTMLTLISCTVTFFHIKLLKTAEKQLRCLSWLLSEPKDKTVLIF